MPSNREQERGIGYPKLTAEQLDLIIDQLLWTTRQRELGPRLDLQEETIAALVGFYTRRWGLPPALTSRVEHLRSLAPVPD